MVENKQNKNFSVLKDPVDFLLCKRKRESKKKKSPQMPIYSATEYFAIIRHKLRREFRRLQGQNADVRVQGGQRRPGRLVLCRSLMVQADDRGVRVQGDLQV